MLKIDDFRETVWDLDLPTYLQRYDRPVLELQGFVQGDLLKQSVENDSEDLDGQTRTLPVYRTTGSGPPTRNAPPTKPKHPGTMMLMDPVHGGIFGPQTADIFSAPEPTRRRMFVWLTQKAGRSTSGPVSIGRIARCDVVVADFTISRDHAWITKDPSEGHWVLTDRGSRNGTKVGDRWLTADEQITLKSGDMVSLGRVSFQFIEPKDFYARLMRRGD